MPGAFDRVCRRVRELFAPTPDPFGPTEVIETGDPDATLIYRLRRWPQLPSSSMNTDIARTLSVMSTRPVNRRWILNNSNLQAREVDSMLQRLVEQGAVEVTDAGKYRPQPQSA